jgi:phage/conjugal plasmid C-4 type zinc finger TraR family protein
MDIQNVRTRRLLEAELDGIAERLQTGGTVLKAARVGGDFLDVAQDLEHQELARLSATRLSERARRLQIALSRVLTGDYGVCSECGTSISPRRLRAIPDVTTCVACQEQLERGIPWKPRCSTVERTTASRIVAS